MSEMPFFSVVIPTYNCAELLKRSLGSVLKQTFQGFEIHVIDNSSTDHTVEVVEAAQKENQRIYLHTVQNNGIIAYSRNVGIKAAKGKWIAFLDSDDVWLPEKLEKVHSAILDNPHAILVCHDEWKVVNGERKIEMRLGSSVDDIYERFLFHGFSLFTSAVSVRRDIAVKIGGFSEDKEIVTVEDSEFWIRLSIEGAFFFINTILGEWHIHGANASKNPEIHAPAAVTVIDYHLDLWIQEHPHLKKKAKKGKGRNWASMGRYLQKARRYSMAKDYALKAISFYPTNWKAWVVLALSYLHFPV